VGKVVMAAASKHLTPCTLELGGKNPTFIDRSAKINLAADRMLLVKTFNAGQWCVDADYVLIDKTVAEEFCSLLVKKAAKMLGDETTQRGEGIDKARVWYNRVVNEFHAARLKGYLEEAHGGKVLCGGAEHIDVAGRFVPFTIVLDPKPDSLLMKEEMFGPILVVRTVGSMDEAITVMKRTCDTPLALYVYAEDKAVVEKILTTCTSGSAGVNTTCEQTLGPCSPFGGVGQSGMGAYHGKFGFDEFSHKRTILYRTTKLPICFLPEPMWPVANVFPSFVPPFIVRKCVTGLVPSWVAPVVKAGVAAGLALVSYNLWQAYGV